MKMIIKYETTTTTHGTMHGFEHILQEKETSYNMGLRRKGAKQPHRPKRIAIRDTYLPLGN